MSLASAAAVCCAGLAAWWLVPPPRAPSGAGSDWGSRVASLRSHGIRWMALLATPLLIWSVPAAVAVAGILAAGGALVSRRTRRAERERTRQTVLEALEQLCAELSAGLPPGLALTHAAETWPGLAPAARAHQLGGEIAPALRAIAEQPGAGGLALVAAAWALGDEVGGSLLPALTAVSARLRAMGTRRRVIAAELASARATGRLVSTLPVAALVVGTVMGADPVGFLLAGPAGWTCLGAGLGLGLGGVLWIEAIADRAEQ